MKILSINELLCLTRVELLDLELDLIAQIRDLPSGSDEYRDTLATLANVRDVLARPELAPRRNAAALPVP